MRDAGGSASGRLRLKLLLEFVDKRSESFKESLKQCRVRVEECDVCFPRAASSQTGDLHTHPLSGGVDVSCHTCLTVGGNPCGAFGVVGHCAGVDHVEDLVHPIGTDLRCDGGEVFGLEHGERCKVGELFVHCRTHYRPSVSCRQTSCHCRYQILVDDYRIRLGCISTHRTDHRVVDLDVDTFGHDAADFTEHVDCCVAFEFACADVADVVGRRVEPLREGDHVAFCVVGYGVCGFDLGRVKHHVGVGCTGLPSLKLVSVDKPVKSFWQVLHRLRLGISRPEEVTSHEERPKC